MHPLPRRAGATSTLHGVLVSTASRVVDTGATSICAWLSSEPGRAVCISLGGVPPSSGAPPLPIT